jgi:hypothetical protein
MARRRRSEAASVTEKRSLSSVLTLVATIIGVLSGVAGLVFLLRPDLQPEPPPPKRSASLALVDVQPRLTRRQYLQRVDLSPKDFDFTTKQLSERGAFVEYRYVVTGYKGKELPVKHELIDSISGDQVSEAETFLIQPLANEDTGDWHAFVPFPGRAGRFYVLLALLEPNGVVPLDRLKTPTLRIAH